MSRKGAWKGLPGKNYGFPDNCPLCGNQTTAWLYLSHDPCIAELARLWGNGDWWETGELRLKTSSKCDACGIGLVVVVTDLEQDAHGALILGMVVGLAIAGPDEALSIDEEIETDFYDFQEWKKEHRAEHDGFLAETLREAQETLENATDDSPDVRTARVIVLAARLSADLRRGCKEGVWE